MMLMRSMKTAILLILIAIASGSAHTDGITKRIKFAKGKHSATVRGAVIRGDRDTYILGARAEQMMAVRITSLEDNAVFTVKGPDGEYLQDAGEEDDARRVASSLPYNGDYRIVVMGTRGNATYRLTVSIE